MKLRALACSLLMTTAIAGLSAGAAGAATVTVAPTDGDGKTPNCFVFGAGYWGPNAGYVYKNVPAFTLAPGDKIGFDTHLENNTDIGFDVSLAATTVNGGNTAGTFTTVVANSQAPRVPRGNTTVGDYDIEFSSTGSFAFPGGGLIIRFSNLSATFAADATCTGNLVGAASSADASGFFVERFWGDADGVAPFPNSAPEYVAAFRIVNTPPTSTGTVGGTGTGTVGGSGTSGTSLVDKTKPTLGSLGLSASVFKAAASGSAFSAQKKRNAPTGTKVSFNLSEPSAVKFTVQRKTSGRRVAGKCKRRTKKNATKRKCTLWKNVTGSFTVSGKTGKNTFTFRGRAGGKALKPGSYRLNSQATDNAKNRSPLKRKGFTIVK